MHPACTVAVQQARMCAVGGLVGRRRKIVKEKALAGVCKAGLGRDACMAGLGWDFWPGLCKAGLAVGFAMLVSQTKRKTQST